MSLLPQWFVRNSKFREIRRIWWQYNLWRVLVVILLISAFFAGTASFLLFHSFQGVVSSPDITIVRVNRDGNATSTDVSTEEAERLVKEFLEAEAQETGIDKTTDDP